MEILKVKYSDDKKENIHNDNIDTSNDLMEELDD